MEDGRGGKLVGEMNQGEIEGEGKRKGNREKKFAVIGEQGGVDGESGGQEVTREDGGGRRRKGKNCRRQEGGGRGGR